MSPEPKPSPFASPAARVTLVMSCLFGTSGVIMVFLPRWLEAERGLDGAAIGAVLSLSQFARVLTGPTIALWADASADRRIALRWLSLAALAAYAGFFFLARDFWSLFVLGFIALSLTQGITPLIEAAVLRATARGKFNYGVARGIGSVAFIIANVGGGAVVAKFGADAVVVWVLAGLAALALATWAGLHRDPPPAKDPRGKFGFGAAGALLRSRRFLLVIVACGLIQSAHGFYYNFSTLVWRGQGVGDNIVGLLWAFGVAVEVAFLWSLAPIERRVSAEAMILAGAGASVARWLALGLAPAGFLLWPLQALHALTFAAAHVGAMRLIYREAPDASAGMAQSLYSATSAGILMGASTLISGVLYDEIGARGYWAMAAMALFGGVLALLLLERPAKRP